ncbi:MAG: HNH endonuclease signature motif containing protein [Ilumatobacteraceae bacterium]
MKLAEAIERLERVTTTRADDAASVAALSAALRASTDLRSFLAASEADLARRLAACTSFPEAAIADTSRTSVGSASRTLERSATLDETPELASALDEARITAGHVDVLTRSARGLEPSQRRELFDRVDSLTDVAAAATVEQFGRRVRREASRILADDGIGRLERQRRETRLSTWVDHDGMWMVRGRFDPVTGMRLAARLDAAATTLFAEAAPDTCPSDPIEKQQHLRALALARLVDGPAGTARSGRPEFVAVIDVAAGAADADPGDTPHVCGRATVTWPIPVEVPQRVLADLVSDADVHTVVVRNGVVLHAPGALDLGRTTRLANRAQRRALRGLYRTCAIPGCSVGYDRCKLHHVVWWRHGGRTDLSNLLPVCSHHHARIHADGWTIHLTTDRRLTITFPDGSVRNTGPPRRLAA